MTISIVLNPISGPLATKGDHPVAVYLAGLASGSRRTMLGTLETIAGLATNGQTDAQVFPWHQLRHEHTAAIRAALAERYSPATANKALAALRGVLKAAWRLGLMDGESFQRAADVPAVRGVTLPRGRSLTAGELRALFDTCRADESAAGRRDAALLAVCYGAGLRRSEAAGLELHDYAADSGTLTVRGGKGGKDRLTYVAAGGRQALDDWLAVRGEAEGSLFLRVRKGGTVESEGVSAQAVYGIMRKRAKQAGIDSFSPHDLRRTFVSDLLDNGADVSMVQQLAGHSQVTTTQRYDRRPERAKAKAAELLHVPYVR